MLSRVLVSLCLCAMALMGPAAAQARPDAQMPPSEQMAALEVSSGVTVFLRDGREFTGRLIEELPHKITIEAVISGIKVEMSFGADEVRSIERYEDEDMPPARPSDSRDRRDARSDSGEGGWVLVPAHGTIGVELTRNFFETCRDRAVSAGAEVVIFELRSPGGYLYSLDEIYEALHSGKDDIRVVFYVDDACFSAAALLCITSDSFYVGPNASFGSAVVVRDNGSGGTDAVNAKYAAAQASIWRSRTERKGRPGILVNAMMLLETELWADKAMSPWRLHASRPSGESSAELVVDNRSILSMTASEAVMLGAADDSRDNTEQLIRGLGLKNPDREAISGQDQARTIIRTQQRRIADLDSRIDFINSVLDRIDERVEDRTLTADEFRRDLIRVRSGLDRIQREMRQTDYIRFQCLLRGVDDEFIAEWKTAIDNALRQLR